MDTCTGIFYSLLVSQTFIGPEYYSWWLFSGYERGRPLIDWLGTKTNWYNLLSPAQRKQGQREFFGRPQAPTILGVPTLCPNLFNDRKSISNAFGCALKVIHRLCRQNTQMLIQLSPSKLESTSYSQNIFNFLFASFWTPSVAQVEYSPNSLPKAGKLLKEHLSSILSASFIYPFSHFLPLSKSALLFQQHGAPNLPFAHIK